MKLVNFKPVKSILILAFALFIGIGAFAQDESLEDRISAEFSASEKQQLQKAFNLIKTADLRMSDSEKQKSGNAKKAVKTQEKAAKIYTENYKIVYNLRKKKLDELKLKSADIKETAFDVLYEESVNSFRTAVSQRSKGKNAKNVDDAIFAYEQAKAENEKSLKFQDESFAVFYDLADFEKYNAAKDYTTEVLNNGYETETTVVNTDDVGFAENSFSTPESYTVIKNYTKPENESTGGNTDGNNQTDNTLYDKDIVFAVQIAASVKPISDAAVKRIYAKNPVMLDRVDGYYKYMFGKFSNYKDAYNAKQTCGVKGAFVVAYKNGKRISSGTEFKAIVPEKNNGSTPDSKSSKPDIKSSNPTTETDSASATSGTAAAADGTEYRLQISASRLPANEQQIKAMNPTDLEVKVLKSTAFYKYTVGKFPTQEEAVNYKNAFGLKNVIVVKYQGDKEVK